MKFSVESIQAKSKKQNEDFYFDLETPRGHFFAVLDFASHDYANLNATLKGKLQTIVESFVSLSRFSADLFLGFLAKEINNFLHNLGEQSGGPELSASAALCLLNGNRLSYFACGDITMSVLNNGRLLPLYDARTTSPVNNQAAPAERLGVNNQESPGTEQVQDFTLQEEDTVLIMTRGFHESFSEDRLRDETAALRNVEPQIIVETLIKASTAGQEDRTLLVIGGPYERYADPVLSDLSRAVAALDARVNALSDIRPEPTQPVAAALDPALEQKLAEQMDVLKDDLRGKAAKIDLLELDEKVKAINAVLASKADTADVLQVKTEVLKLGIAATAASASSETPVAASATSSDDSVSPASVDSPVTAADLPKSGLDRSTLLQLAALVLIVGVAAAFLGAWLQSRTARKTSETWAVKTAGNQILISRVDDGGQGSVTMNVANPLPSSGEQRFSSFADVQRYIDTLTATAQAPQSTATPQSSPQVVEITMKQGDSLKKLSERYAVPAERIMELNPQITRWPAVRIGQRVIVPAPAPTTAAAPATPEPTVTTASPSNTIEVIVAPGDSINRFALRYRTTPERIKELNPHITNWAAIQTGQKVLVPNSPAG